MRDQVCTDCLWDISKFAMLVIILIIRTQKLLNAQLLSNKSWRESWKESRKQYLLGNDIPGLAVLGPSEQGGRNQDQSNVLGPQNICLDMG
jgi:hypothetical protein